MCCQAAAGKQTEGARQNCRGGFDRRRRDCARSADNCCFRPVPKIGWGGQNVTVSGDNTGNVVAAGRDVHITQTESPFEAQLSGILMPSNEPDPPNICGPVGDNAVKVFSGGSAAVTEGPEITLVGFRDQPLVSARLTEKGAFLSAHLYRSDSREIVHIVDNRFKVNENAYFQLERPDRHELTIRSKGAEYLRVRYLNETSFLVEGLLSLPDGQQVRLPPIPGTFCVYEGNTAFRFS